MFDTSVWQRMRRAMVPALGVLSVMLAAIAVFVGFPCMRLGIVYGVWTDRCPTGDLRLDVEAEAYGLVRGQDDGRLVVTSRARWVVGDDRYASHFGDQLRRGVAVSASLVDADEQTVATFERGDFRRDGPSRTAEVTLPELPDGDYVMRVEAEAGFESRTVDLEVPLYTPALVHLMTDRPLYKPGQLVQFRAVVLARTDRAPLEDRPGRWTVTSPDGLEMLVERSRTGPWGIVAGTFPLDAAATVGSWTVRWQSGEETASTSFDVRRFSLPRLGVEVASTQPWAG
ncbi:MAG: MG2 domain-containing protein, partial [Myxococcota bacterium]